MLTDSQIGGIAAISPFGSPPTSKYERLIARAKKVPPATTIVVHPCDETSLRGAVEAAQAGIIVPILVGPAAKISAVAREHGIDIDRFEIVDAPHSEAAAAKAVGLDSRVQGRAADEGQPAHRRAHARGDLGQDRPAHGAADQPRLHHGCADLFGDAVHHRRRDQHLPDLDAKRDIVQNAIDLFTQVGLGTPRVAILSAVETVTSKIPSTIDAAALCKMADRGQITGGILDGPLAFDNAIDPEAARIKGIKSAVAGHAQILVVPDLEAGNMLAKNLFSRPGGRGGDRARRTRADHPDLARRFRARAHGVLRGRSALCACAPRHRGAAGGVGCAAMDTILVVNAGSSSVKFQVFETDGTSALKRLIKGQMDGIGVRPRLRATASDGAPLIDAAYAPERVGDAATALALTGAWLREHQQLEPIAVGHRVVHGGPR